jgi:hypothetical protein
MLESFLSKEIALYVISSWRKVYKISNYSLFFSLFRKEQEKEKAKRTRKKAKKRE